MIKKEHLSIWLNTTEEEIKRLKNCKDYINKIYYKNDAISYNLHEDLLDIFFEQIHKNETVLEFINIMIDVVDGKRMDTLLPFRDLSKPILNNASMELTNKLRMILLTPSTEPED
jgi:hypothetical protein